MPATSDLYAELMMEYYRLEESLLAEASSGLAAAKTPEAGRAVLGLAVSQLREFVLRALQSQAMRLSEIKDALKSTGDSLASAQLRMEDMERENAEAAAVLFKMKVRSESSPQAAQAQELADRVIEQERLLQKREGELAGLRRQVHDAKAERESLLRRLEAEELRAEAPEPAAAPQTGPEVLELNQRLQEAQAALLRLRADSEGLARRLQEAEASALHKEAERAALDQRLAQVEPAAVAELEHLGGLLAEARALVKQQEAELAALQARPQPADEVPSLRARLAELERRLAAEPVPDVEALRSQLKEEENFRNGFIQRIHALEAARHRAQEEAKVAAAKIAAAEKVPWAQERAALLAQVGGLEVELNRQRAVNENIRSEWTETSARQEAMRLAEIAGLKRELEKLRPSRKPG
ncbi:MAG: hypothetical protein NTY77_13145 [Elusimicrobia bacterium]|nr:hypothetical protein [Elusimicrobiota bacterium]